MKPLFLSLVLVAGTTFAATGFASPTTLDFHIAEPQSTEGTMELPLKGTRQSVHLRKAPLLTVKDLKSAEAVKDGAGKETVVLTLKPDSAVRFEKATAESIGRKLGIVLDGKLVLAPEIKTKISAGTMTLGLDLPAAEAKVLAARLNEAAKR